MIEELLVGPGTVGIEIGVALAAYTAGLLDGDGWIYWQREPRPDHGAGHPSVGIAQTLVNNGGEVLAQLQKEWGGIGAISSAYRVTNLNVASTCFWWTIRGRSDAEWMLSYLRPYLRIKAGNADLVLERLKERRKWSRWGAEEDALLIALYGVVSLREIGEQLGRGSSQAVGHRAAKLGLRPMPAGRLA